MKFKKLPMLALCSSLMLLGLGGSMAFCSCSTDSDFFDPDKYQEEVKSPEDTEKPSEDDPSVEDPSEDNPIGGEEITDLTGLDLSGVTLTYNLASQIKEYTGFTVSFNKENKTPNYVVWELLASETYGSEDRGNYSFWQDKSLDGCPTTDYQYTTYSYQRGHMCPAADQKWSAAAMKDCMVMANMCPQYASLNEKAWATLENKTREWARRDGAVWVIAGPLYSEDDDLYIGTSQVRVASSYFKVLLAKDIDEPRAIAFVFPNSSCPGNLSDYSMTVDQLEELLGYDFFSELPDSIEDKIEAVASYSEWDK